MIEDEAKDRAQWEELIKDAVLGLGLVAVCVIGAGLMGAAFFYWGR